MEIDIRTNWTSQEVAILYALPLNDLLHQAHTIHRQCFDPNVIQKATLLSIKTGACPEDCAYCPQSARYKTDIDVEKLLPLDKVLEHAKEAKKNGATRFCMGAAWRNPKQKDLAHVKEMIQEVKALGMETCATLGMVTKEQAEELKESGLDYYNHNIDTAPEFYPEIISTHTYEDRLKTLAAVREADINVCCGGIVGMGESREHRINLLLALANQPKHPESVPINLLTRVKGTPLQDCPDFDRIEFVRTIAVARIVMPKSYVRLSAGRSEMSDELQILCFFAGVNSIHYGAKLLTTFNPSLKRDNDLLHAIGMRACE